MEDEWRLPALLGPVYSKGLFGHVLCKGDNPSMAVLAFPESATDGFALYRYQVTFNEQAEPFKITPKGLRLPIMKTLVIIVDIRIHFMEPLMQPSIDGN